MQNPEHVNIPKQRYIELLEAQNALYRIKEKLSGIFIEPAAVKVQQVTPYTSPFNPTGCNLNAITKRIHATGISVKQWAKANGFKSVNVRLVICGHLKNKAIIAALIRDGFMEAPCS